MLTNKRQPEQNSSGEPSIIVIVILFFFYTVIVILLFNSKLQKATDSWILIDSLANNQCFCFLALSSYRG